MSKQVIAPWSWRHIYQTHPHGFIRVGGVDQCVCFVTSLRPVQPGGEVKG